MTIAWRTLLALAAAIPATVHAQEVPREQWLDAMTTSIPTYFCQSGQYFRECFGVSATECEDIALSGTRVCISQFENQIPEVLRHPVDVRAWGTRIGNCAGTSYEAALLDKRLSNPKCNDPRNWQPD